MGDYLSIVVDENIKPNTHTAPLCVHRSGAIGSESTSSPMITYRTTTRCLHLNEDVFLFIDEESFMGVNERERERGRKETRKIYVRRLPQWKWNVNYRLECLE